MPVDDVVVFKHLGPRKGQLAVGDMEQDIVVGHPLEVRTLGRVH